MKYQRVSFDIVDYGIFYLFEYQNILRDMIKISEE